ncbi:hypothetical protein Hanom_Chr13g01211951 [Helianthus anomalus]
MSMKRVNTLWLERFKAEDVLQKRDHDREDPGNPDAPASSQQSGASSSTQVVVYNPQQIVADSVASGGSKEELERLDILKNMGGHIGESSTAGDNVVLNLALTEMKVVDDATIDEIPSEPEVANLVDLEKIVFEGDAKKSKITCMRLTDKLKNRDSSDVPTGTFDEWRKKFLTKTTKLAPFPVQVDYMKYEKVRPHGKILGWIFIKDIHCMDVKHEHGIQYFRSLLSILT